MCVLCLLFQVMLFAVFIGMIICQVVMEVCPSHISVSETVFSACFMTVFFSQCISVFLMFDELQFSLDPHYTEDEIFELSLAREPRSSLSSVS